MTTPILLGMISSMIEKVEKKRLAILRILRDTNNPIASHKITEQLVNMGFDIRERTVRFHLLAMDKDGLTEYIGRQGRKITKKGILELSKARVIEKVGFLNAKIDQMTYSMNFNLLRLDGTVVVNVSLLKVEQIEEAYPLMVSVFKAGYAMGRLITLFNPGEQVGEIYIPDGFVGIGTVCSITLNGVLLAHGIPTNSRFGGVLEIVNKKPTRFVEIINYDGTSLDPLEIFSKSGMTNYIGATTSGNGLIGASFREVPAVSRDKVIELANQLEKVGIGGVFKVGWPGQSLCEIPINEGLVGVIVIGGLNPVAILEEYGFDVNSKALSGLIDYNRLFSYQELENRVKKLNYMQRQKNK